MNQAGEGNPVLVINYLISNANDMPTAERMGRCMEVNAVDG